MNLFFIDYDLIPLLVHENYLNCYNKRDDLHSLVKSTEHISLGDLIERKIRSQQEWNLLPNKGIHSTLAVCHYSGNFISYPKFPELMGKFQKIRKVKREIRELKYSFHGCPSISIKEEIVPLILSKVTDKLIEDDIAGIDSCLYFLKEYKLPLDTFKENVLDLHPNIKKVEKFNKINSQVRANLTRRYNEAFKTSIVRKKRKEKSESSVKYDEEGNIIDEVEEEGESEKEEENSTIKIKAKKSKTTKNKKSKN
jgi:replication factor C subunit 1